MALSKISNDMFTTISRPNAKPIFYNGDMAVAQRSASTASITNNGYHTVDRIKTFNDTMGTWTQSQSTTVPSGQGFATSLKMDCTTADASPAVGDRLGIRQQFEGQNIQLLKYSTSSAETTTLSFWVRSNKTGTYIVELYGPSTDRQISKSYTISSADTWEKKTITFDGDTGGTYNNDNSNELILSWYLGAGTNYTSGTLSTTWGSSTNANRAVGQVNLADNTSNEWYITGVQLEAGEFNSSSIPPFQHESFENNLARCQRYYYQVTGTGKGRFTNGNFFDENDGDVMVPFPCKMRAAYALSSSAVGDIIITSVSAEADCTAIALDTSLSLDAADVRFTVGSDIATIGHVSTMILKDSGSYLAFDAEL